ncbi:MAG: FAD-dependent oxidoreductase [Dehalococcoidia bacterium]|nr:MAG: FAD-dependent oxidoreductase [Dehalococcoidia bacterium]
MKLFEPGKIGKLCVKNRIVMAAMNIAGGGLLEPDGRLSQQGIDYYVTRAKGGAGLIITSTATVNRDAELSLSNVFPYTMMVDKSMYMARLSILADAVHDYGARLAVSISAMGPRGGAPSALPSVIDPRFKTRELTLEEIEGIVRAFGIAAAMLRGAGVDAVELNGHLGITLLDQFMTARSNVRTDKYGGNLEGRLRFAMEVTEAVKKGAGSDFPIIYKYGLKHYLDGGREIEEGLEIARRLEAAGADAITADAGCWETTYIVHAPTTQPPGLNVDMAVMAKKAVTIPVMAVGKLGYPELAESVLQQGKADFIMMGRPLLADPEWPHKVREGRLDDIRPCLGCLEGCMGRGGKYLSCTVNPTVGIESELTIEPAEIKKTVLVVGGGPGGMEAARVAALRGHRVTLWEKDDALGGNLIPASVPGFKQDYARLIDYLSIQIEQLGVAVELGREATVELIQKMAPDIVFLATGSTPIIPEIPGIEKEKVGSATDVLLGKKEVGESVVVLGGGLVGCETALYLAQQGKKVTIVEILGSLARDMFAINRMHLMKLLIDSGVRILMETTVSEITDDGVVIIDKDGKNNKLESDSVVLALGLKPNRDLADALGDTVSETRIIGDCVEPRKVMDAVWEGFRFARLV